MNDIELYTDLRSKGMILNERLSTINSHLILELNDGSTVMLKWTKELKKSFTDEV